MLSHWPFLLGITGNETYIARDGMEAIEAADRAPARSGAAGHRTAETEWTRGLPAHPGRSWGKDIVVIALTGWGQEEDRRKSQEAGFDGHLVKPVDYDELLELLSSLTNGSRNVKLIRRLRRFKTI